MADVWQEPVDLDNCDREPIHVPGAIQPHGYLLALSEPDLTVSVASANLEQWIGVDAAAAIGRPVDEVVAAALVEVVRRALTEEWSDRFEAVVEAPRGTRAVTVHRSDGHVVVEVEDDEDAPVASRLMRDAAIALNRAGDVAAVADAAAAAVRALTGFDRVMVYRFDDLWNGEVIAERRRDDLNTFLGLHYPASDIPAQARELYRRNWIRTIPDIRYEPVPLLPGVAHDSARPLDLSTSVLRSVSPIHVEYLQNMGVDGSMSLSLIIGGELWGLIACHHYSGPLRPTTAERNVAEHLAQLTSVRVAEVQEGERRARNHELTTIANRLAEAFAAAPRWAVEQVLREHEGDLLKLTGSTGMVVVDGTDRVELGAAPPRSVVDEFVDAWPQGTDSFHTDRRPTGPVEDDEDDEDGDSTSATGALGVSLTLDGGGYVMWFRPELRRTVDWGGDPHNAKLAVQEGDSVRLSPRRSFEQWRDVVRGRSEAWDEVEVAAGLRLGRLLSGAILRRDRDAVSLATDLQRIMLPAALPAGHGIALDGFSTPDGAGIVGGDWYDAFPIGTSHLAIAIGDVAGHGLDAAAVMAQLRNGLRAYLVDDPSPARALHRLNGLAAALLPGEMATAVVGLLDLETRILSLAGAGHPSPLLVRDGVGTFVEPGANTVLGFQTEASDETELTLRDGDVLVLYSDGLIESRHRPLDHGFGRLVATAVDLVGEGTEHLASALVEQMTIDEREDDVTVLTMTVGPSGIADTP